MRHQQEITMIVDWLYAKVHRLEVMKLANGAQRKKTNKLTGEETTLKIALGGNAIAVYLNLRGRAFITNSGRRKFLVWASHKGLSEDLGWDHSASKQRISNAIKQLIQAELITMYVPTDKCEMAVEIRELIGHKSTNIYELVFFKELYLQGHFFNSIRHKKKTPRTQERSQMRKSLFPPIPWEAQQSITYDPVASDLNWKEMKLKTDRGQLETGSVDKLKLDLKTIPSIKQKNYMLLEEEEELESIEKEETIERQSKSKRNLYNEFKELAFRPGSSPMGFTAWEDRSSKDKIYLKARIFGWNKDDWETFAEEIAEYEIALDTETITALKIMTNQARERIPGY